MSEVLERLKKYAGLDKARDRCPANPCITVREAIEIANEIERLRDALRESRDTFERYALHHAAKVPPDSEKAATNAALVRMCDEALGTGKED